MNHKHLSLIGLLLITLIVTSCNKKETPNDLKIAGLKGKVKSVSTSLTSNYSNEIIEKRNNTKTLYNIEGFEIYKEDLGNIGGDDGEFSNSKTEIKRDSNNNKTEENTTILSGTTSYKSSNIKYNYNSDGNLIEKVILYDDVIANTTIYKYDDTENIIEESQLVNNGSPYTTIYKYDEKNNLIEQKSNGYTENYEYNSKGDVSLKKLTMNGDKHSTNRIYKYNNNGDKINETYTDRGNSKEINYKYDTKNNLIEIVDDENGYITNYEYDNFGNWIKEIKKFYDDTYVIERKIEYYSDEEAVSMNNRNSLSGKYQIASERILSKNDIVNIDKYELKLMKNEIFARYGYIFKTAEMKAYFESQTWYKPQYDDVTSYLTEIEKSNIALLNGTNDLDSNNPEQPGYFKGQTLKTGEKIIKINWGKENKTNYTRDMSYSGYRYASKSLKVPNGKKWILIYINEDFTFESGHVVGSVPDLFIDNRTHEIGNRRFSNLNNINPSRARDENIKIYSGSTVKAISSRTNGKGVGDNFIEYFGEMWLLEIND
ncbi:YARHG domain-containing protein [Flavobacterium sp.]|jgi:hypothetical protein|uniref:YARHG domain-containing protein n=1 Tax=Flavobacterium sp. TaxID=239 RepID=UPI0037C0E4D4